mgnify:CR=1 FL=1
MYLFIHMTLGAPTFLAISCWAPVVLLNHCVRIISWNSTIFEIFSDSDNPDHKLSGPKTHDLNYALDILEKDEQ